MRCKQTNYYCYFIPVALRATAWGKEQGHWKGHILKSKKNLKPWRESKTQDNRSIFAQRSAVSLLPHTQKEMKCSLWAFHHHNQKLWSLPVPEFFKVTQEIPERLVLFSGSMLIITRYSKCSRHSLWSGLPSSQSSEYGGIQTIYCKILQESTWHNLLSSDRMGKGR